MTTQAIEVISGGNALVQQATGHMAALSERIKRNMCTLDMKMRTAISQHDEGAATAEYAIVLVAATGFGALLVALLKSGMVKGLLEEIVKKALGVV